MAPSLFLCNCATIFGSGSPKWVKLDSNPSGATMTVAEKNGATIRWDSTCLKTRLAKFVI